MDKEIDNALQQHAEGHSVNMKEDEEIRHLRLDYKKIVMIDYLWKCKHLVRLDLNNNLIKKIEGLDSLINLTWLNLSFNRIEKIEGLESLRKLEVLNLTNNRISVIENMDALEKLTHFLIGHNHLGQLDNLLYLQRFKNLFTINLHGNPFSEEEDYVLFIAAYFPNVTCVDYRLINLKTRNEASIKYDLEELKCEEAKRQKADEAAQSQDTEAKLHAEAFVEFLNGSHLFKSMLKDDPEAKTLHCVPEVADLLHTFEKQMAKLCVQLFEIGLAEHKQRETKMNSFYSGHNKAVADYQHRGTQILAKFEPQHKERIVELQQLSDQDVLKVKTNHCKEEINQLCNTLMELEFQLVSQLEDFITKLDVTISVMVRKFCETAQEIFAQCRDLEDFYHEKMQVVAAALGNMTENSLDEDMPDDVKALFADKDTVLELLTTIHENHLLKINDRETQLITRAEAWKVALIKEIQDKELERSRLSLSDIHRYIDYIYRSVEADEEIAASAVKRFLEMGQ